MQPLAEITLTRPWLWGIAILGDATADMPDDLETQGPVAIGTDVIIIKVRHAQDIDAARFEGDGDWATATIHIRSLSERAPAHRHVLCETVIGTPETISLGDAEGTLEISPPSVRTRVVVSVDEVSELPAQAVWVDLIAVT